MAMLEANGLVKIYGRRRVVDGVDFEVERGEIVGLLGPNGAGKTTSFRMTCGMIEPDAGQVLLNELDVTDLAHVSPGPRGHGLPGPGVERLPQALGREQPAGRDGNARHRPQERAAPLRRIARAVRHRPAAQGAGLSLSGGERRRLEIARCLVSNPKIILLDEPFTGIDPVTIDSIQGNHSRSARPGHSILITDHQVRETLEITDRSYVIRAGKRAVPRPARRSPEKPRSPQVLLRRGDMAASRLNGRVWPRHAGRARRRRGSLQIETGHPADNHAWEKTRSFQKSGHAGRDTHAG